MSNKNAIYTIFVPQSVSALWQCSEPGVIFKYCSPAQTGFLSGRLANNLWMNFSMMCPRTSCCCFLVLQHPPRNIQLQIFRLFYKYTLIYWIGVYDFTFLVIFHVYDIEKNSMGEEYGYCSGISRVAFLGSSLNELRGNVFRYEPTTASLTSKRSHVLQFSQGLFVKKRALKDLQDLKSQEIHTLNCREPPQILTN